MEYVRSPFNWRKRKVSRQIGSRDIQRISYALGCSVGFDSQTSPENLVDVSPQMH